MEEDDPWKDFCEVTIDEEDARKWVGEVREEDDDRVEADESWQELDPEKVAEARAEEVAYMKSRGLWNVVPIPDSVVPVSVRWVDVVKADGTTRSRLVARDFKGG